MCNCDHRLVCGVPVAPRYETYDQSHSNAAYGYGYYDPRQDARFRPRQLGYGQSQLYAHQDQPGYYNPVYEPQPQPQPQSSYFGGGFGGAATGGAVGAVGGVLLADVAMGCCTIS